MSANVQMLCAFGLLLFLAQHLKLVSLLLHRREMTRREQYVFLLLPVVSVRTFRATSFPGPRLLAAKAITAGLCAIALAAGYAYYWPWVLSWTTRTVMLAYAALPLFLLAALGSAAAIECLAAAVGVALPPIHRTPLAAKSIREFWSRRWNRWVSDWLGEVVPTKNLRLRLGVIFGVSGLLHELVLPLPLLLITDTNLIGTMLLFFGLHGALTYLDVRYVRGHATRRVFFWVGMLATLPLFINEAMLRVLQLWP